MLMRKSVLVIVSIMVAIAAVTLFKTLDSEPNLAIPEVLKEEVDLAVEPLADDPAVQPNRSNAEVSNRNEEFVRSEEYIPENLDQDAVTSLSEDETVVSSYSENDEALELFYQNEGAGTDLQALDRLIYNGNEQEQHLVLSSEDDSLDYLKREELVSRSSDIEKDLVLDGDEGYQDFATAEELEQIRKKSEESEKHLILDEE